MSKIREIIWQIAVSDKAQGRILSTIITLAFFKYGICSIISPDLSFFLMCLAGASWILTEMDDDE